MRVASRRAALRHVRSTRDLLAVLHFIGFAAAVPLLMRLPLPRVAVLVEPSRVPTTADPKSAEHVIALVLAALQLGRPFVSRGCLTRGVTLYYALRRAGDNVSLQFGIAGWAATTDRVDGHCWLVKDGLPYLEARDPRELYEPMYAFTPRVTGTTG